MHPNLTKRQEKIVYWILTGFLMAGILMYLILHVCNLSIQLPMCMMLRITGCYCPGCGGTRAFLKLLQGRFLEAVYFHPIVPYGALVGGWYFISHTLEYISKGRWEIGMRCRDVYLYAAIAIIFLNWIVKNAFLMFGGIRLL